MPSNSDTETCIEEDSHIVTVSLGATRTLLFKDIATGKDIASIKLSHGDMNMSVMSKES
jgi:alkylated DNA repair dioxygenase AlkB